MNIRTYWLRFLICCAITQLGVLRSDEGYATEQLDRIVAIVNDDVIMRSELDARQEQVLSNLQKQGEVNLPPSDVVQRQVLESLISTSLQLQEAARAGIDVDAQTVARAIGSIAEQNNLTLGELREVMERDGVSFNQFREQMRKEIIISRLQNQEVRNRILVSDQEIDNLLASEVGNVGGRTDYHLFHILVTTPDGASTEDLQRARGKAQELVARLRGGADFQETALASSDGRQALEGGDLGWRKANELPSLFTDVVAGMEKGEISDPIQSPSGFHIIKLADYQGASRQIIKQTHVRHILVATNEITSDQDAQTRLRQLKSRIENGEDFAALARSHSDDQGSAIQGGDLGWVSTGDLAPRFEQQMDGLAFGDISDPFRTQFGWHIVQVMDRRDFDNTEEAVRNRAREIIRERKSSEATELWLRRLRDEAYVEIRLDQETP